MSRFLFATYPGPGHVAPAAAVVEELTGRGHEVRWYTGRRFAEVVAKSGARFCAMPEKLDWDYENLNAAFPKRVELKGQKQRLFDLVEIFVRPLGEHLPILKSLLNEEPAEVFVSHTIFLGGGWLHEMGGPPNATLGDTCLIYPSRDGAPYGMGLAPKSGFVGHLRNRSLNAIGRATVLAPVTKAAREVRTELGLPPIKLRFPEFGASPYLHIQLSPPASSTHGRIFPPRSISSAPPRHLRRRISNHRSGGQGFRSRSTWSSLPRGPSLPTPRISFLLAWRASPTRISSSSRRLGARNLLSWESCRPTRSSSGLSPTVLSYRTSNSWSRTAALVPCNWPLPTGFRWS